MTNSCKSLPQHIHYTLPVQLYTNKIIALHMYTWLQLIWQKLYKTSQEDYGTLNSILARIGRSKANKPKANMHTCQAALFTVFKGHIVTAGCKEFDIKGTTIHHSP